MLFPFPRRATSFNVICKIRLSSALVCCKGKVRVFGPLHTEGFSPVFASCRQDQVRLYPRSRPLGHSATVAHQNVCPQAPSQQLMPYVFSNVLTCNNHSAPCSSRWSVLMFQVTDLPGPGEGGGSRPDVESSGKRCVTEGSKATNKMIRRNGQTGTVNNTDSLVVRFSLWRYAGCPPGCL